MSIYIDEPLSKIVERLEGSLKESQKDLARLQQVFDNNESPANVIDSLDGGFEDALSYCKDIREMIRDVKGVL